MEVSKLKNLDIMREILQICNQPRYKDFGFIKKNIINDFDADKFLKLTIRDQYTYIINALTSLNKDLCSWRFTKGTFFADKNWYVFKESITGLYSKKFKI